MDAFADFDAIGLSRLIRNREITAIDLLETVIRRIEKINPKINAVIYKTYELARETARDASLQRVSGGAASALFYGVPFLLKNLVTDCRDTPFDDGSRAVHGHVSRFDSELVKRYKAAGLIITGKTNASEFGVIPAAEPELYGPTKNPWDPELTPGGSSGGSAAAVAAGIVPMAHANDGGGSLRIPASCCGLFGLKPTRGRNPLGPLFGDLGSGIVHEHAVTVTVRDSAALLDCTSGPDIGDPYPAPPVERPYLEETKSAPGKLHIGFLTRVPEGWNEETDLHPDCMAAVEDAALLCESLGHRVDEVSANDLNWQELAQTFVLIFSSYVGHDVDYWERTLQKKINQAELEPATWELYQESLKISGGAYLSAWENLQLFIRKISNWYLRGRYDILLTPTMRIPPTKTGSFSSSPENPMGWIKNALSFVAFTRTQNITGQPAMSVPLYWNKENIPVGVQFAARFGEEAVLFRLAAQLEQARPWMDKKPPLHCSSVV